MKSKFTISEDLSFLELENIYNEVLLKQKFYDSEYGTNSKLRTFNDIATLLKATFSPEKHIDIGCGRGFLVQAMRQINIDSYGVDFSNALINSANKLVRKYLKSASVEQWISENSLSDYDLITFMEVFEHLPVRTIENMLHMLSKKINGFIFLTIPSYGLDTTFKVGISVNEDQESWIRDMKENCLFKNIVLENGIPHHGHITLGSYKWWTFFFLFNGFIRNIYKEEFIKKQYQSVLKKYNLNPYVLNKKPVETNKIFEDDRLFLGNGWHLEEDHNLLHGRWTDGHADIYFYNKQLNNKNMINLLLSVTPPSINIIKEYKTIIVIEQLVKSTNYQFKFINSFISAPLDLSRKRNNLKVKLFRVDNHFKSKESSSNNYIYSDCYKLTIISPTFSPQKYSLSIDYRKLGIIVHEIEILDLE